MAVPVRASLAFVLLAVLGWTMLRRPDLLPRARRNPVIGLTALAVGLTFVQLLPVPAGVLRIVAPFAYQMRSLFAHSAWFPLSLDVPATCSEGMTLLAYLAAAILAPILFGGGRRQRFLIIGICLSGAGVLLLGFAPLLLDGLPPARGQGISWTFVNPNHAAGYLGFVSLLAIGHAFDESRNWRALLLLIGMTCGLGVALTLSRGGIVCYNVSVALLIAGLCGGTNGHTVRAPLLAAFAATVALGSLLAYSDVVHELWTLGTAQSFSKAALWRAVGPVLHDFPYFGMGRGVFAVASPHYLGNSGGPAIFTHLENEWLQTLTDFGPGFGAVLIGLTLRIAWPVLGAWKASPTAAGFAGALVYLGLQNINDFSLQSPAIALPVVMLLSSRHGEGTRSVEDGAPPKARWVWAGWSAACACAVAMALVGVRHTLANDTKRVESLAVDRRLSARVREERLMRIMNWHPADYVMSMIASEGALARGALRNAKWWCNAAMRQAGERPEPYRQAGRIALRENKYDEAATAYGVACMLRPADAWLVADEIFGAHADLSILARVGMAVPGVKPAFAEFSLSRAPEAALQLLESGAPARHPGDTLSIQARAHLLLGDAVRAAVLARQAQREAPETPAYYMLEADALAAQGQPEAAVLVLRRGVERTGNVDVLLPRGVQILIDANMCPKARQVAQELLDRSGSSTWLAHRLKGRAWQKEGKVAEALREYEMARTAYAGDAGLRLEIAALKESAGDLRGAVEELEIAQQTVTRPQELQATLERLRRKMYERGEQIMRERLSDANAVF